MTMTKTYTARRTQDQWKTLVEQWQQSGQSARQFCEERNLGYASFCQWRKRLIKDLPESSRQDSDAPFIDLASLTSSSNFNGGWHIVLSLGNGIELKLSQV
jgi:putative transposase